MDFTNLKLLQALSGIQPYQGQDENSFNSPSMSKDGMFSGMFPPEQMNSNSMQSNPIQSPEFSQSLQHSAGDRLNQLLDSQPSRDNYKPSMWQKISAGLMSVEDPRSGQELLNRKFNNATDDWKAKLKPVSALAGVERSDNTNNRLINTARQRDENADLERDRKTKKDESDSTLKDAQLAEKRDFLTYLKDKQSHPNHIYKTDKEGYVYSLDPQTDTVNYPTDDSGNRVKADKLPEMEKLTIQNNNTLKQISARGSESRNTAAVTGSESRKTAEVRGEESRKTKTTTPGKNISTVNSAPKETKRVKVISPSGKTGTIPENQLAGAIKQGYKVQ